MEHICKYWGDDKLESLLKQAEETVRPYSGVLFVPQC